MTPHPLLHRLAAAIDTERRTNHVVAGRLDACLGVSGEDPALLDDYLTPERIAFVEWPGQAGSMIERVAARVSIEHLGGDRRLVEVAPA